MILKQGARLIPVICNGQALEDLDLSGEELVVDKSEANFLKAPDIFTRINGVEQLSEKYHSILKEVFSRFSFEGKMGEF